MKKTQLTLVQIDNYGPWTVTPEPRPEPDLQTMQSRLFADLSQHIGRHEGYIFFTRFDNMLAVTNGMTRSALRALQRSIGNRYPVTISLSTATDHHPATAAATASRQLQAAGSAQDGSRREILRMDEVSPVPTSEQQAVIAHFDVNDVTTRYTDTQNAYDTFLEIEHAYAALGQYMRDRCEALSFFVGGDNIIAVTPELPREDFREAIEHVDREVGVSLKVGVGVDQRAQPAGMAAKHALEVCRSAGSRVELGGQITEKRL